MRKAHEAQGSAADATCRSGAPARPRREFLHVDDCADALVHLMQHYSDAQHVNVGSGRT